MGILKILRRFLLFSVTHFASLLFLSIFIAGTIIVSCVREEVINLKEKSYEQSEIMDAMQWFEERIYAENYMLSQSGMQLYKIGSINDVLITGVSSANVPGFVSNYFNTAPFTSYKSAIDNGYVVLTDIPTGQSYTHCVTIVGYHPNGDLVYMDPELGVLRECPASYPLGNIKIPIIGNK